MKSLKVINQLIITLFLSLFVMHLSLFSQKAPLKFGKVDKADLEMKVYPPDTSAAAVILCDYCTYDDNNYQSCRTLRIKILKKEGLDWANKTFPGDSKCTIRGITFNLEGDKIVESKLTSESIFKEKVTDNTYRTRVAMPNVKEGSVFDLEFAYSGLPREWWFQEEIPVRWSELDIGPFSNDDYVRKTITGVQSVSSDYQNNRWVAKDVPAFKEEPFMNNLTNYITKLYIEFAHTGSTDYSTTWNSVSNRLISNTYFGATLTGCWFLNNTVKEIEAKYTLPLDKLKAAHEAIRKAVKWNQIETLYTTVNNLNRPFNNNIGNSADINLMLTMLARKLKLNADLVVLSTRNNGMLTEVPSLSKLNYVVACVSIDDKKYFVDATEEFLPIGMLPVRCLNSNGRLIKIDDKMQEYISLKPDKKSKEVIHMDLKLESDLFLTGHLSKTRFDYDALNFREDYQRFNSLEEYLKDFENDHQGLSVTKCEIKNQDSIYNPLLEEYDIKVKNKVTSTGDLFYINPLMYEQMESNPFKSEDRKYPVDFIYPTEKLYLFKLTIPENMQISEAPKSLTIKMPDNSAMVQYQATIVGKVVQVSYKLSINKPIFNCEEYANLRMFFSEIVKKHAEPIIIKSL